MFKIKKTNKLEKKSITQKLNLKEDVLRFIIATIFFFIAIFLTLAPFSYSGQVGDYFFNKTSEFFGIGYFIIPIFFFLLTFFTLKTLKERIPKTKIFALILFLLSILALIQIFSEKGGHLGLFLSNIQIYIETPMTIVLFLVLLIISLVIIIGSIPNFNKFIEFLTPKQKTKKQEEKYGEEEKEEKLIKTEEKTPKKKFSFFSNSKDEEEEIIDISTNKHNKFIAPPLSLLFKTTGKIDAGDVNKNAEIIRETLESFGMQVEVVDALTGPTVTRYSIVPAPGIKVSRILALTDDLALALAAKSILIEAPIPGESKLGIEIPNKNKITIGARELFASKEFQNSKLALPLAIGKDISGMPVIIDLAYCPHMLIAGATGAGKSVTVHAIINSLLFTHGPDTLKFILIDPKRVEMTLYNHIPHLLTPVIIDPKKAILSLRWAIKEMERRYEILEKYKLRDIQSYHKYTSQKKDEEKSIEAMPYIVIAIDELADIMQQFPKELESGIVSIAQKARAVGIHLILSTQRPSVDVVTGLIKANIPTRIALQVSSAIDSKTIINRAGAERLLGRGDMLYLSRDKIKPTRIQSLYISDTEVKNIVKFIKKAYKKYLEADISLSDDNKKVIEEVNIPHNEIEFSEDEDFNADELLEDAKKEVITSGKASTSYLQRKLSIGYARAAKLIDILEERGIVGPANGSKPREVLVKKNQENQ